MGKGKSSLVKNASVLMVASIISRVIGLIYRRPLGETLGSVGLGYYGYASNLYAILLLVSSYSIPMAVSKIVSERLALKQYKNAQKVFKGALLYACLVGGIAALVAFFLGRFLLPANQINALPALRVLAPTIFLSAILGVFRGYFQAHKTMTPTSVSQILEQILNAVVSVLAAWLLIRAFAPSGGTQQAIYGAMGGTMGTGAGVITGLIFMLFVFAVNRAFFRRELRKDRTRTEETYADVFRIIFLMVTPVIFTTFLNNANTYLDSYIYAGIQGFHGVPADAISAAYGEYSNYYIPICNIPMALASASGAAMMPEVSGRFATRKIGEANREITKAIRLTMFLVVPCVVGLIVLAKPIMGVLFPASSDLSWHLLTYGAVYLLFAALASITASVLQSIGKQRTAMINAGIALLLNLGGLALMLALFSKLDVYAVMLANLLYWIVYSVLNSLAIKKYLGFKNELPKTYIQPLISSAAMAAAALGVYYGLFILTRRPSIALIAGIIVAVIVYLIVFVIVSRTTPEEMRRFPMGTKIVKFLRLIRVYR